MIKTFLRALFHGSTDALELKCSELKVFDLVSTIPNPTIKDVYLVYAIDTTTVFLIKWVKYNSNHVFDANIDKQVCYSLYEARNILYKVINFRAKPEDILMNSSVAEINTFAQRLRDVHSRMFPLMGLFIDSRDDHLMLVTNRTETNGCDYATVYDLTTAPTAGILHFNQVAHVVRTKDLVNGRYFIPLDSEKIMSLFSTPWRKELLNDITSRMFVSIVESEKNEYPSPIYLKNGFTKCINRVETNNTTVTGTSPVPINNKENKEKEK